MKCLTVKEIDNLLEQISKNIDVNDDKENIKTTKTNEVLDKLLNERLKEAKKLFEEKSNKEEHAEDENLCSFSSKEINKIIWGNRKTFTRKRKLYSYKRKKIICNYFKNEEIKYEN